VWSLYTELGDRSFRKASTFTRDYTPEESYRLIYNQDVHYQVLIMGDQVRSQCRPFQLMVIKRKCNRLLSEHIGYHPSAVIPPTFRIRIHLSITVHSICTVQLVETLRYKPEGRGFDSQWRHWNFSLTLSFRAHYGRGVDSASNRKEYHKYFLGIKGGRCVGLTTLPPSCVDCLEI
jgi:hypothetical protein